jgi:hypothetical protein
MRTSFFRSLTTRWWCCVASWQNFSEMPLICSPQSYPSSATGWLCEIFNSSFVPFFTATYVCYILEIVIQNPFFDMQQILMIKCYPHDFDMQKIVAKQWITSNAGSETVAHIILASDYSHTVCMKIKILLFWQLKYFSQTLSVDILLPECESHHVRRHTSCTPKSWFE